jgi:uncharacterized membrane protein
MKPGLLTVIRDWFRASPWWVIALGLLIVAALVGVIGDGYLYRTLGGVIKCALGLAIGYYAHRHLVMQGRRIPRDEDGFAFQGLRSSRALLMGAAAIAVAVAV